MRSIFHYIMKKNIGFYIKSLVSLLFIYLILRQVNWDEMIKVVKNADLFFLVLAFVLSPIMVLVSAWKWYVLIKAQKIPVSFYKLCILYYVGYFFNNLLPSNVGGDLVVTYELAKHTQKPFDSAASVFMNRFTGLLVLIPAALLSMIINASLFSDLRILLTMGAVVLGTLFIIWLILDNRALNVIESFFSNIKIVSKFMSKVKKTQESLQVYKHDLGSLFYSLFISILFYILMVINVYVSCLAFNINATLFGLFMITPFIQIVSMIPITLGGLGLKEWSYVVAFPQIGISASVGLSVSLLLRLKGIISGLIGGIMYPLAGKQRMGGHETSRVWSSRAEQSG